MYKRDCFSMQLTCKFKILSSREEISVLTKRSGITNEIILSFWLSTQKLVLVLNLYCHWDTKGAPLQSTNGHFEHLLSAFLNG